MYLLLAVVTISSYLIYNYTPELIIEPQAYTPHLMKLEGPLAVNKDLDKAKILLPGQLPVPESLAYKDGLIYASVDGKIVSIKDDTILKTVADLSDGSKFHSRPLGLRFYNEDLYVADGGRGLVKVDVKTGKVTVLISKDQKISGKTLHFPNDLDVADGVVYFSDSGTTRDPSIVWYNLIEHVNTGRVYKYTIATGKAEVLLDNLYVPNGIQVAVDKKSVLISELINQRILRHYVSGLEKGRTEVFVQLPGEPDNIRPSSSGGYWVAIIAGRDVSSPSWIDRLWPYPTVIKVLCKMVHSMGAGLEWANQYISSTQLGDVSNRLKSGFWLMSLFNLHHAIVVELSPKGEILRSYHSSTEQFGKVSQGLEVDGHLYLGSFANWHILKIKL